eukprot:scaffold2.g7088.t1
MVRGQQADPQERETLIQMAPLGRAASGRPAPPGAAASPSLRQVLPRWWVLARLWFSSEDRWHARGLAGACAALSLVTVLLLLKISNSAFQSALTEKKEAEFYAAAWSFVGVIVVAAPLFALTDYVDRRVLVIVVRWREWLAGHLLRGVDNPDQRITEDVRSYASSSTALVVGVLRKVINCVAFAGLLWSIEHRLVLFLFAYAFLGTWITAVGFGRRLMELTCVVLQREADLRFELVRVRENAESVAFYRGDQREAAVAARRLGAVVTTTLLSVAWQAWLSLWQNVYNYATILIPSLLMAPKFFRGEIRFGEISQVSFAFFRIESALSYIVRRVCMGWVGRNLTELSGLGAQTERVDGLLLALEALAREARGGAGVAHSARGAADAGLCIERLTLCTPGGEQASLLAVCVVVTELDLSVPAGQSLLVVGPSGSGKSSLMRAVAGLWSRGSGSITTPPHTDTFFLPQKPYMTLGELREQLTFPDTFAAAPGGLDGGGGVAAGPFNRRPGPPASDAELAALLEAVRLPHLLQRMGGLDAECDWAHVLSLGEQQRIAFLRLLYHAPALAFLDEATSAVDAATEAALYAALRERCPCYVSIGHRMQLVACHTHVLEAVGEGRWVLYTAPQFQAKLAAQEHLDTQQRALGGSDSGAMRRGGGGPPGEAKPAAGKSMTVRW